MALVRPVLVCFVASILLMCLGASYCDDAPSCTAVVSELVPCLTYLRDGKRDPSAACCAGVKAMAAEAKTKNDKTAICECIKKALTSVKYEPSLIPTLSAKCSVSVNLPPIDQKTDCSKAMNPDKAIDGPSFRRSAPSIKAAIYYKR